MSAKWYKNKKCVAPPAEGEGQGADVSTPGGRRGRGVWGGVRGLFRDADAWKCGHGAE